MPIKKSDAIRSTHIWARKQNLPAGYWIYAAKYLSDFDAYQMFILIKYPRQFNRDDSFELMKLHVLNNGDVEIRRDCRERFLKLLEHADIDVTSLTSFNRTKAVDMLYDALSSASDAAPRWWFDTIEPSSSAQKNLADAYAVILDRDENEKVYVSLKVALSKKDKAAYFNGLSAEEQLLRVVIIINNFSSLQDVWKDVLHRVHACRETLRYSKRMY